MPKFMSNDPNMAVNPLNSNMTYASNVFNASRGVSYRIDVKYRHLVTDPTMISVVVKMRGVGRSRVNVRDWMVLRIGFL